MLAGDRSSYEVETLSTRADEGMSDTESLSTDDSMHSTLSSSADISSKVTILTHRSSNTLKLATLKIPTLSCARETVKNLKLSSPLSSDANFQKTKKKGKYKRILSNSHPSTRSTLESPHVYNSQISTKNILIQPYKGNKSKERGCKLCKYCYSALLKLIYAQSCAY